MSELDDYMGRQGSTSGNWHKWQQKLKSDGMPEFAERMVWDQAAQKSLAAMLQVWEPLQGIFKGISFRENKYEGEVREQMVISLEVDGEETKVASASKRLAIAVKRARLDQAPEGSEIKIQRFGRKFDTDWDVEVLTPF